MSVLGFAWSVYDTSHDRNSQIFDTGISVAPYRHTGSEVGLNVIRHFLKQRACGPSASWTGGNARRETTNAEALQNILTGSDFFAAVAARRRRQAGPNRVANPFRQYNCER